MILVVFCNLNDSVILWLCHSEKSFAPAQTGALQERSAIAGLQGCLLSHIWSEPESALSNRKHFLSYFRPFWSLETYQRALLLRSGFNSLLVSGNTCPQSNERKLWTFFFLLCWVWAWCCLIVSLSDARNPIGRKNKHIYICVTAACFQMCSLVFKVVILPLEYVHHTLTWQNFQVTCIGFLFFFSCVRKEGSRIISWKEKWYYWTCRIWLTRNHLWKQYLLPSYNSNGRNTLLSLRALLSL